MIIHPHGYWLVNDGHIFDASLCGAIVDFLKGEKAIDAVDFGCGPGRYVEAMNSEGIKAKGFDGSPWLQGTPDCYVADLSQPFFPGDYDWALSLEVGEHIPSEFQETFLDNVAEAAAFGVILSWAVPGQGGRGHVNCQTNEWVKAKMLLRGFVHDDEAQKLLRGKASESYYRNTLMVFRRKGE